MLRTDAGRAQRVDTDGTGPARRRCMGQARARRVVGHVTVATPAATEGGDRHGRQAHAGPRAPAHGRAPEARHGLPAATWPTGARATGRCTGRAPSWPCSRAALWARAGGAGLRVRQLRRPSRRSHRAGVDFRAPSRCPWPTLSGSLPAGWSGTRPRAGSLWLRPRSQCHAVGTSSLEFNTLLTSARSAC